MDAPVAQLRDLRISLLMWRSGLDQSAWCDKIDPEHPSTPRLGSWYSLDRSFGAWPAAGRRKKPDVDRHVPDVTISHEGGMVDTMIRTLRTPEGESPATRSFVVRFKI